LSVARPSPQPCGAVLARAEQTFDRAAREDDPAWLSYFDEAYLAARMAQCFRDLGESGHAVRHARRSLDMDGRDVRDLVCTLHPQADVPAVRDFTAEVQRAAHRNLAPSQGMSQRAVPRSFLRPVQEQQPNLVRHRRLCQRAQPARIPRTAQGRAIF